MDDEKKAAQYVDMWKKSIDVQQHFNDIEWRIRGLALTALTFALGAAAVAARDRTTIGLFGYHMPLSACLLFLGLFVWWAFYFVDQIWYHQLLIGAVLHGTALEVELRALDLAATGLTHTITTRSHYQLKFAVFGKWSRNVGKPLTSSRKMQIFYLVGAFVLFIPAIGLWVGAS